MRKSRIAFAIVLFLIVGAVLASAAAPYAPQPLELQSPSAAYSQPVTAAQLCGDGSESDKYGFNYDLRQPHWTVNWDNYVQEDTVNKVDAVLDGLNADNIAQTMILFLPADQVGTRVNCAVHFLRYMELGNLSGARKDNGFVFLIVVEKEKIDVHYGVGLGLPALTAQELTPLNRLAEDTYQTNKSMDDALLRLINGFDQYARSKYKPLGWQSTPASGSNQPTAIPIDVSLPTTTSGMCALLCVACVGIIILFIVISLLSKLARLGGGFGGWSSGGGSWGGGGGSWGGGGDSGPSMRGGGGSGRSGRGN